MYYLDTDISGLKPSDTVTLVDIDTGIPEKHKLSQLVHKEILGVVDGAYDNYMVLKQAKTPPILKGMGINFNRIGNILLYLDLSTLQNTTLKLSDYVTYLSDSCLSYNRYEKVTNSTIILDNKLNFSDDLMLYKHTDYSDIVFDIRSLDNTKASKVYNIVVSLDNILDSIDRKLDMYIKSLEQNIVYNYTDELNIGLTQKIRGVLMERYNALKQVDLTSRLNKIIGDKLPITNAKTEVMSILYQNNERDLLSLIYYCEEPMHMHKNPYLMRLLYQLHKSFISYLYGNTLKIEV